MASASPPLLLALVHGVGPAGLATLQLAGGEPHSAVVPLTDVPADPAWCLLGPADASTELLDLGIAVDRSNVLFRSTSQPDDAVLAALPRRATGPAPVTILEFTSVLAAARVGGCAAVPNALTRLTELLAVAAERLRAGDHPELWLVGLGAAEPVHTMFDLRHHWQRQILAPLSHELRLVIDAPTATVVADNQRALDLARHLFASAPFARFGAVATIRPDTLQFVAGPGIAFGSQRIAARAPHHTAATAAAGLPFAPSTATASLDFRGLLARFWMRAAALHAAVEPAADGSRATARASKPAGADLAGLPAATALRR